MNVRNLVAVVAVSTATLASGAWANSDSNTFSTTNKGVLFREINSLNEFGTYSTKGVLGAARISFFSFNSPTPVTAWIQFSSVTSGSTIVTQGKKTYLEPTDLSHLVANVYSHYNQKTNTLSGLLFNATDTTGIFGYGSHSVSVTGTGKENYGSAPDKLPGDPTGFALALSGVTFTKAGFVGSGSGTTGTFSSLVPEMGTSVSLGLMLSSTLLGLRLRRRKSA
jgi:hypothetical protein